MRQAPPLRDARWAQGCADSCRGKMSRSGSTQRVLLGRADRVVGCCRRPAWRLAIAFLLLGSPARPARADSEAIVQVQFPDLQSLDEFLLQFPETVVRTERRIVRPELLLSLPALAEIQGRGYPHHVLLIPEESGQTLTPPNHNYIVSSHYTFAEHLDSLQALVDRYPGLTLPRTIGYSPGGRPICALKISDNPQVDEDEPVLLLAATTHSDEDVGVDITLEFMRGLLSSYGTDIGATDMVNGSEIWVVPLLNPDGWALLESGQTRNWRKNLRDNNGDQGFDSGDGVDLNRNYSFNWELGTATVPTLPTYRGPFAFSEGETVLLRDLMNQIRPDIALTYHQWGDVVIIPWRWNGLATPDSVTYRGMAARLAASITGSSGAPYPWYEDNTTAGFMDDWLYGVLGGFCFTVEVTTTSLSSVDAAVANNQEGIYQAWSELYGPQITGRVLDSVTGMPVATHLEVLEIDTSDLAPRATHPGTGRYRRMLVPGSYTLRVTAPGYLTATLPFVTSAVGPTVMDVMLQRDPSATTAVEPGMPSSVMQISSHPNPGRGPVSIDFKVGTPGMFRLDLFDLSGRRVRTLMDGHGEEGWSRVEWNGVDDHGDRVPAGVYVVRLARGGQAQTSRLVWLD